MDKIIDKVMQQIYKVASIKSVTFSSDPNVKPSCMLAFISEEKGQKCHTYRFKGRIMCSSIVDVVDILPRLRQNCHNYRNPEGVEFLLESLLAEKLEVHFDLVVRSY